MKKEFFILGFKLSTYWSVFFIGVVLMIVLNCYRSKKREFTMLSTIPLTLFIVISSFLGAKILYYLEDIPNLINNGIQLGGVSFFGSMFFLPITMISIARIFKLDYYSLMDFVSPSLMLMLAVLRIGCYISECCGGITLNVSGSTFVFPTQITECVIDLIILIGLLLYERYWETTGRLYFFIMTYYGVFRFFLEFLRDTPKNWLGLSHGQWFAIISVAIGGYMLNYLGKRDRKLAKKQNKKK